MRFFDRKTKAESGTRPAAALSHNDIIKALTAIAPGMFVSVSDAVIEYDDSKLTEAQKAAVRNKITELGA